MLAFPTQCREISESTAHTDPPSLPILTSILLEQIPDHILFMAKRRENPCSSFQRGNFQRSSELSRRTICASWSARLRRSLSQGFKGLKLTIFIRNHSASRGSSLSATWTVERSPRNLIFFTNALRLSASFLLGSRSPGRQPCDWRGTAI